MRTVVLTSGPRGAGKTTYANKVKENDSGVVILSRDNLLMRLYGATLIRKKQAFYADHHVWDNIKETILKQKNSGDKIILDYWNEYPYERDFIISSLRKECNIDCIICWKFVLPVDICVKFFLKKTDRSFLGESWCKANYELYYEQTKEIEKEGFDLVQIINPLRKAIPTFPLILEHNAST